MWRVTALGQSLAAAHRQGRCHVPSSYHLMMGDKQIVSNVSTRVDGNRMAAQLRG